MRLNRTAFVNQSIKIKGDLIPEAAAEEIIGELQALFARHNAGAALSATTFFKPTKEFTRPAIRCTQRRRTWRSTAENAWSVRDRFRESGTPQGTRVGENAAVNVVPVAASEKTKLGRGGEE